ncbi:uncharacterized protein K489DRAFT_61921 [Dissoconium aciculare CBS 342.82]|uniref:Uncharacterized protein n=1 Tax=Dissoconium aciculare CBS 342.82 TaxID=1314786 RepID=A0A6J3LW87_9PEZI|nr:uncharacterized protein K489DRAFT_61921 [Dissoconium aciculare CBS 342.82]KAF1819928.1 hypothetical protein K489DRAFT_61921 [Dissoconium aciculare CBS 342.82]
MKGQGMEISFHRRSSPLQTRVVVMSDPGVIKPATSLTARNERPIIPLSIIHHSSQLPLCTHPISITPHIYQVNLFHHKRDSHFQSGITPQARIKRPAQQVKPERHPHTPHHHMVSLREPNPPVVYSPSISCMRPSQYLTRNAPRTVEQ